MNLFSETRKNVFSSRLNYDVAKSGYEMAGSVDAAKNGDRTDHRFDKQKRNPRFDPGSFW